MKIFLFFMIFSCFCFFGSKGEGRRYIECCWATCPNGNCSTSGTNGGTGCYCDCSPAGDPICQKTSKEVSTRIVCANMTQIGNMQQEIVLYQNFQDNAGSARATILNQIITLFQNNNYYLDDNTSNGNVETYDNLVQSLESIVITSAEQATLTQFLSNCSLGEPCQPNGN